VKVFSEEGWGCVRVLGGGWGVRGTREGGYRGKKSVLGGRREFGKGRGKVRVVFYDRIVDS